MDKACTDRMPGVHAELRLTGRGARSSFAALRTGEDVRCSFRMTYASHHLAPPAALPRRGRARAAAERRAGRGRRARRLPPAAGHRQGGDLRHPRGRDRHRQHRRLGQDLRALPPRGDRRPLPEGHRPAAARRRRRPCRRRADRGHLGAARRDRRGRGAARRRPNGRAGAGRGRRLPRRRRARAPQFERFSATKRGWPVAADQQQDRVAPRLPRPPRCGRASRRGSPPPPGRPR